MSYIYTLKDVERNTSECTGGTYFRCVYTGSPNDVYTEKHIMITKGSVIRLELTELELIDILKDRVS
jgi:hypothetical protein